MAQVHATTRGWAAHLSNNMLMLEIDTLDRERMEEHRKLTRKARRTPRHVLQQRRPSVAVVTRG